MGLVLDDGVRALPITTGRFRRSVTSVSQLGGSLLFVPCPVESDCSFLWSPVKVKGSEDKGSRESKHRVQFEPGDADSPEGHF